MKDSQIIVKDSETYVFPGRSDDSATFLGKSLHSQVSQSHSQQSTHTNCREDLASVGMLIVLHVYTVQNDSARLIHPLERN